MSGSYKSIPPMEVDIGYTGHALLKMHFFVSATAKLGEFISNNPTLYYICTTTVQGK